jgi:hypothetical protein
LSLFNIQINMKRLLLLLMLGSLGIFSCTKEKEPEPQDSFGTTGGLSLKLDNYTWKCEKFGAEYDSLFKAVFVSGARLGTTNGEIANVVLVIPFNTPLNVPQKIGGGYGGVRYPYLFVSSLSAVDGLRPGYWDSRTESKSSEATFTITKLTTEEVRGTFSGELWDLNLPGGPRGSVLGTVKISEGQFRLYRTKK